MSWTWRVQPPTTVSGCSLWSLNTVFTESSESSDGKDYPVDIWLVLASYIRPEDVCRFALICRNAWTVTCTAAFWTRLYRRWGGFIDHLHLVVIIILQKSKEFCFFQPILLYKNAVIVKLTRKKSERGLCSSRPNLKTLNWRLDGIWSMFSVWDWFADLFKNQR